MPLGRSLMRCPCSYRRKLPIKVSLGLRKCGPFLTAPLSSDLTTSFKARLVYFIMCLGQAVQTLPNPQGSRTPNPAARLSTWCGDVNPPRMRTAHLGNPYPDPAIYTHQQNILGPSLRTGFYVHVNSCPLKFSHGFLPFYRITPPPRLYDYFYFIGYSVIYI